MSTSDAVQRAVELAKQGKRDEARDILKGILTLDKDNVRAWAAMSQLAESRGETIFCLEQVLRLKPGNEWATWELARLLRDTPTPEGVFEPRFRRVAPSFGRVGRRQGRTQSTRSIFVRRMTRGLTTCWRKLTSQWRAIWSSALGYFAPAQYEEMSDAQKLSRPSFEKTDSGISDRGQRASILTELSEGEQDTMTVAEEQIEIDSSQAIDQVDLTDVLDE